MKKFALCLSIAALVATGALAGESASTKSTSNQSTSKSASTKSVAPKQVTVKGEIIDTGCYLAHGARGEKHSGCAHKCIANGMPMGLLTADGTLYLLTMDHDNADPYNEAKELAAKNVEVSGLLLSRNGMKAIDVSAVKAVSAQ